MRKLSTAGVAIIMGVVFYFTLFWGSEALRMLTSPTWGLDDAWRSQFVFVIGGMLGLAPLGLIKLAAFFAVLKLAIAFICAFHLIDRFRCLVAGKADADVMEGGLILIVAISILAVGPAVWSQNVELAREYTVQLVLAALVAALFLVERRQERDDVVEVGEMPALPKGGRWFSPWR